MFKLLSYLVILIRQKKCPEIKKNTSPLNDTSVLDEGGNNE